MDRKTIIGYVLIVLVFLLWFQLAPKRQPTPPAKPPTTVGDSAAASLPSDSGAVNGALVPPISPPAEFDSAQDTALGFPPATDSLQIVVDTPFYRLAFSTRGAVVTSCRLKKYHGQVNGQVELVRPGAQENLNLLLYQDHLAIDFQDRGFAASRESLALGAGEKDSLVFIATSRSGARVAKTFIFSGDTYDFKMRVQATGMLALDAQYDLVWGSGMAFTEKPENIAQDLRYSKAYVFINKDLHTLKKSDRSSWQDGSNIRWVAQRRKYFEVAIIPQDGVHLTQWKLEADTTLVGKQIAASFGMGLRQSKVLEEQADEYTIYCGPIDKKLLSNVDPSLESTMNWGWAIIAPFSKAILWSMKGFHSFIPNYGLVLIIFSILIKVILWPLTHKSTKAMSRLSALQPKIKELQEKHKASPDKLNKAMMLLYKEQGVNPLSGCWPTLLQMPLLYALFIVFNSTIELRGAPFIFWIKDLSMPDVVAHLPSKILFYGPEVAVLPIIMGITQFLTSKMMITDPKQKFTVYFMPFFMVLIFNSLPSGLTLYYTLFNVWTYLQQLWLKKQGVISPAVPSKA